MPPLESTDVFSGLDETSPRAGEDVNKGDDHIRLIKKCEKNIWPGAGGQGLSKPITVTEDELISLTGVTSNLQTQINALSGGSSGFDQRITDNTTNIATNTGDVSSNSSRITTLENEVTSGVTGSFGVNGGTGINFSASKNSTGNYTVTTPAISALVASSNWHCIVSRNSSTSWIIVVKNDVGSIVDPTNVYFIGM